MPCRFLAWPLEQRREQAEILSRLAYRDFRTFEIGLAQRQGFLAQCFAIWRNNGVYHHANLVRSCSSLRASPPPKFVGADRISQRFRSRFISMKRVRERAARARARATRSLIGCPIGHAGRLRSRPLGEVGGHP